MANSVVTIQLHLIYYLSAANLSVKFKMENATYIYFIQTPDLHSAAALTHKFKKQHHVYSNR